MGIFKQTPPPAVQAILNQADFSPDKISICSWTDIDSLGNYQKQWLAVNGTGLIVVLEGDPPSEILRLDFAEADEFRIQPVVGSGILQARMDGMFVDILRFTSRLSEHFQRIARKLDRHLKGVPIEIHPEDECDDRRCTQCGLMLEFPGDTCPRCVNRGAVLVRMFKLMSQYRGAAILMMMLLLMGIVLDLVSPQLTRYLVDHVLPGTPEASEALRQDSTLWQNSIYLLMMVVLTLASVQLLRMFVNIFNGVVGSKIGTAITFDMRSRLVSHLQHLSIGYYDRQQVGSLVGRVAYDTEALHGFVMQLTNGFLFQLLMVIGVGIMMFTLDPILALCTLIPAPLVMAGSVAFWKYVYPRYYRFWDASSKQAGMLSGTLSGIRVVKAFSQEEREIDRFNGASDYLRRTRRHVDYSTSIFNPIMTLVFQFGGWIVWFVGGREVLGDRMTLGSLMAFFAYLAMFYGPLTMLTQFTNWLTQFVTQAHRIFEILDTPCEIQDAEKTVPLDNLKGEIVFDDVTFGYTRSSPVIHDINLHIKPGEFIGVVGRSGSGKTTVVNLICRFYDVNEGRVLIDGIDVRDVDHQELTRHIGVVLQEPFLFRGSIWQNITYGRPGATPEEVIAAAKASNSHDFIVSNPHGYDTWVGERGAGLSGGERQRLGIGRVLLTDPKILILDEATSNVDAESEASIQNALAELVKGRTTIAIAHRLSTLRRANRIIVVDDGRILESGTHQELIEHRGLYAKLIHLQGQMTTPTVDSLAHAGLADKSKASSGNNGPLPDLHSHKPRWLDPEFCFLHLGNLGSLHLSIRGEDIYRGLFALRCLPVHHPFGYIALRCFDEDKHEVEVGLIRDLREWPEEARRLIELSLRKRYFVHTITSIEDIHTYNGYLNFIVETDLGKMDFMLRWQHDRAHDYGVRGKMLLDTEDNRYLIPDVTELPVRQRNLFQRHIYW